jgi:hypothetical protein
MVANFIHITPVPSGISRDAAISQLHDHRAMIELNPLVIRHELTHPPPTATPDEAELGTWYTITDLIHYLPAGLWKGETSYKACFYNLPVGIQTHVLAPAGVDIRSKWSIGGNEPHEPREPDELGIDKPRDGLYIKEEVELRCNFLVGNFVKRTLKSAHHHVHQKVIEMARKKDEEHQTRLPTTFPMMSSSNTSSNEHINENAMVSQVPSSSRDISS